MLKGELDMRIAICDDEKDALQQTINIVNNVFYEMNIQCYIDQFTNALDLVQCKKQYDVIFLDIELKEHDKNGVWAAKMTKQKNPESIIIFTTNHEAVPSILISLAPISMSAIASYVSVA